MVAMYLELNSPRRRDINGRSPSPYRSPPSSMTAPMPAPIMGTPKAQQKAYMNHVPIVPEAQPLSQAIERYVNWMSCQGVEVPRVENLVGTPDYVAPAAYASSSNPRAMPVEQLPNGILHIPRTIRPRALGKNVRWRDKERNKKTMGCFAEACGGESALVDVQDESGVVHSGISFQRTPTPSPKARGDPILSFRESEVSIPTPRHRDHYEADTFNYRQPQLRRAPSPHQRVQAQSSQSTPPVAPRPISMRRAPSPHPKKIAHQQQMQSRYSTDTRQESQQRSRSRNASQAPVRARTRLRSNSPAPRPTTPTAHRTPPGTPKQRPSPRAFGMRRSSSRDPSAVEPRRRERSESPGPNRLQRMNQAKRGSHTPQRDPPSVSNSTPQKGTPLRRRRSSSRQGQEDHKRYAEPPEKAKRFSGELPRSAKDQDTKNFAEIVWKSKEDPLKVEEKKKKGWKLVRISSRSKPQPESLQYRQGSDEDPGGWVSTNNSSMDQYDRYGSKY